MESKGIARTEGSFGLTLLSSSELLSYIIAATVGDHLKGSLVIVNIAAAFLLSLISFLWTFVDVSDLAINIMCLGM